LGGGEPAMVASGGERAVARMVAHGGGGGSVMAVG